MVPSTPVLSFLLAIAVTLAGADNGTPRHCGTNVSTEKIRTAQKDFRARRAVVRRQNIANSTTVSVYFHIITDDDSGPLESGNVPDSQIHEQIKILNADFALANLRFNLVNISRTVNSTWFRNVTSSNLDLDQEMKTALRRGGAADLNLFTVGFKNVPGMQGYSTLPLEWPLNPTADGSVILFTTLPGGSHPTYNLGRTGTHEVGHWVGLYHPFSTGCDGVGDYVDDTPAEAEPAYGCPEGRDTCSSPGLDPIHNFMDYSDDHCRTEFTVGQIEYFKEQLATYRGISL